MFQPFKKVGDFSEINVQTQTLDDFCSDHNIENIDILKIDTEGNEYNVLNLNQLTENTLDIFLEVVYKFLK